MPRFFASHPRTILLCAYAALCLALLGATPLWLDELLQLGVGWDRTLKDLLPWIEVNPGAVPLPYVVQHASLNLFGYTAFAARLPAAIFSILAGCVFARVTDRLEVRRPVLALAIFLAFPLQFRYALEARGYSQGLFFSVALLWVFLVFEESPSPPLAWLYFFTVAVGLYFHPFLIFPAAAQMLFSRRVWIPTVAAALSFIPWILIQHYARQHYSYPALFPVGHLTPLVVLHELTGAGYVATLCLLILAGFGIVQQRALIAVLAAASIAGPLLGDAVFHYFFAGRQFLLAVPALALLAAAGFDCIWQRSWVLAALPAIAFLAIAAVKDFQDATVPKDDLGLSAEAVAENLTPGACVLTAPAWALDYYQFFRRDVKFPACADPLQAAEIIVITSPATSTPAERQATLTRLPAAYTRVSSSAIGHSELTIWRPAGPRSEPRP